MKSAAIIYFLNRLKTLTVFIFIILLTFLSGYIIYQLLPNVNGNYIALNNPNSVKIKILLSDTTIDMLSNNGLNPDKYKNDIQDLALKLKKNGISYKIISDKELPFLNKNDILFAPDTYAVSQFGKKNIKKFLSKGGTLIFNFRFGYFNENNRFFNAKTIEEITGLKKSIDSIPKKEATFYIQKRISPLNMSKVPFRQDLVVYDPLPIFHSDYIPDIVLTNWSITTPPMVKKKYLSIYDDGIAWHGFYGKGKWFYFSFPTYVFLDMKDKEFKKIINNIILFSKSLISISSYPFINKKNGIFISEDTEYKYPYGYNFATLAKKHKIDVTLFAVAKLAKKYENITKAIAKFQNCEIGSHSYSHIKIMGAPIDVEKREIIYSKQLLEKITGRKIYGFRPPREEIDDTMEKLIKQAGYIYVMEKSKPFLLPMKRNFGIITIPRLGTDDYTYLIDTDFNKSQILKHIILETNFLTALNGTYTLSVHTHLLSYKSNITVLDAYFTYLNHHLNLNPLKGKNIALKSIQAQNIYFNYTSTNNIISLNITNNNTQMLKNISFRLYNPNIKITDIIPEISTYKIKILLHNKSRRYYDLQISHIPPKTTVTIFIKYKKL